MTPVYEVEILSHVTSCYPYMLAGWWWYWRRRWPCWGVGLGSWSVKMTETHTISYDTCWDVLGCTGIWFFHHVFNHFLVWCCFYFFGLLWAVLWSQLSTSFNQRGLWPLTLCSGGIFIWDFHLNSWLFLPKTTYFADHQWLGWMLHFLFEMVAFFLGYSFMFRDVV